MNYELYHDESLEGGFWHGMLLVPISVKTELITCLDEVRRNRSIFHPISFKNIKEKKRVYDCADSWIQTAIGFLRSDAKGIPQPIFLGKYRNGYKFYEFLPTNYVGAKFILFCERDNHKTMKYFSDHASKIETTFRIGLKGGLHYLGNDEEPIHITKMHFDGYEHYKRHLDKTRIVDRMNGLREYCSVSNDKDIIDDRSSDHRMSNSQDYMDCQLIQLTDLLIGCWRSILGKSTRIVHKELSKPMVAIFHRYREGYTRMQNSRWRNSICLSRCFLEDGKWKFENIEYENSKTLQMSLPIIYN